MSLRLVAACVVGIALTASSPASAQPEGRRDAARAFAEGTKAFDAGDYIHAARTFELAYSLAPHSDALWNAARAWHMAGERPRAANAYAHFLREAPPNAADRAAATSALKALSAKLGRIEINLGAGVDEVRLDDAPITGRSIYVVPGVHVLRASSPRGPIEQQPMVQEGQVTSVVLASSAEAAPAPTATSPTAQQPPANERDGERERPRDGERPRNGLSPTVVWIGGAVTVVLAGLAAWSGLDTWKAEEAFDAAPTHRGLEEGRDKQLRTNVLLVSAIGVAALTSVAAIWLVDWRSDKARVGLGIGRDGVFAAARF